MDSVAFEGFHVCQNVVGRSVSSKRNEWRVFAKKDDALPVHAIGDLIGGPFLQGEHRVKIDVAKQMDFQRCVAGGEYGTRVIR